ncbi:Ig-like domain-containing protein [Aeromicrobium sp. UC242_57]|uniref:Ig-like domain-containing protein n=1 Tax=Aeromicrobium sp. UC242_57 TaxID=3374624 RepID=UPI0037AA8BB3
MSFSTSLRRRLAVTAASALAASTLLGSPLLAAPAQAASPTPTHGATVDYFDDVYSALGADSVFETVTIERFEYILKNVTGNVAFLIGDPGNASTQATIGHIQDVADDLGVDKIYNFTPKLDGDTLNVWDLSKSGLNATGRTYYSAVGDRLLNDYLNKDTQPAFTKTENADPYLFVYNKDRTIGSDQDRIVASLSGAKTAADLDTPAEVSAYETQVEGVLDSVSSVATTSNFDFQKAEVNRRHTTTAAYADASRYGGNILDDGDNTDGFRIQTLTYPELEHLLQQPGDFPILFGGTWCHNTRAIIKFVNADAQKYGVKTVYNFDFSLFSTSNGGANYDHIRDNPVPATEDGKTLVTRPSHLYGDLVNTYLTNAVTQYRTAADVERLGGSVNAVSYYPGGDTSAELKQARKIQVGHFLTYNKDRVDALGQRAPVVDQAIRQNDDGGNTEHMTEWWYTAGNDYAATNASLRGAYAVDPVTGNNQLQSQRAFAKEALAEIDTLFRGFVGEKKASTTGVDVKVDGSPVNVAESSLKVGDAPTLDVSVAAPTFAPFISLNTSSQNAAPAPSTGKPRGTVVVLDGSTKIAEGTLKRDGTASIQLPALTQGEKSLTVKYAGRGELIESSQKALTIDVVGEASAVALTGPAELTFGTGGEFEATVTSPETGTLTGSVRLDGLPGAAPEGTITDGVAKIALPASTPGGTYDNVVARYAGDDNFGSSVSAPLKLTIKRTPATLTHSVVSSKYGTSAKVNVQVEGPAGVVPTGQATVTVAGKPQTVALNAAGKATIVLPKTLAPKVYAATIIYGGNGNLVARSAVGKVTVAKGTAKAPTFAAKGTIKAKKAGKATVKVATTSGLAKAGGKVKVVLKKGKTTRTINVTVKSGVASVKLPKLAKGKWSVKVTYAGDANYVASKTVSKKLTVK